MKETKIFMLKKHKFYLDQIKLKVKVHSKVSQSVASLTLLNGQMRSEDRFYFTNLSN